jgi:hypothetical protein
MNTYRVHDQVIRLTVSVRDAATIAVQRDERFYQPACVPIIAAICIGLAAAVHA